MYAGVIQLVECLLAKQNVAGSSPAVRSNTNAGRQDKGRPAAFQAEDRGVRVSPPVPLCDCGKEDYITESAGLV